ncbi:uncharacterized protein LOC101855109 [Aplysia californica]|uniref:Uncharacterized protein LOC101855109 n=1 Tax=Aplysia californica TaxID=6500 RepID=A0ABM0JSP2_APLCA|nr:uncharacterized protein LOC101855109 [Aplysia californica]
MDSPKILVFLFLSFAVTLTFTSSQPTNTQADDATNDDDDVPTIYVLGDDENDDVERALNSVVRLQRAKRSDLRKRSWWHKHEDEIIKGATAAATTALLGKRDETKQTTRDEMAKRSWWTKHRDSVIDGVVSGAGAALLGKRDQKADSEVQATDPIVVLLTE